MAPCSERSLRLFSVTGHFYFESNFCVPVSELHVNTKENIFKSPLLSERIELFRFVISARALRVHG